MTTHYQIQIIESNVILKATYRSKKWIKLEKQRGTLSAKQLRAIGLIIPPTEEDMDAYIKEFKDRITYSPIVKDKSIFTRFTDLWFEFYIDYSGFKPAFSKVDGRNLKQIITNLTKITGTEAEALEVWSGLLNAWKKLDKFHQQQTDLKYINSKLNILLNAVKKANNTTSKVSGAGNSVTL